MYKSLKFMIETSYLYHNIEHKLHFSEEKFSSEFRLINITFHNFWRLYNRSLAIFQARRKPYPMLLLIKLDLR